LTAKQKAAVFVLSGKAWEVESIDWKRGHCNVKPSKSVAQAARWLGGKSPLGFELCQAMRDVLVTDTEDAAWSKRACEEIAGLRAEHRFLRDGDDIVEDQDGVTWWTFAGGKANLLLSRMLEHDLGGTCVVRNTSVKWKTDASASALRTLARQMAAEGRPTEEDALRFAAGAARRRLSKFEPCLPPAMLDALTVERALDAEGAAAAARATTATSPTGAKD
jgi:ATP-dependent Lhr-like helicase